MNRKYEELALNAWPALTTDYFDGWLLKVANGYTKRANSVYPIYDSTLDFDQKVDFCENYYNKIGLLPTFKMNDSDMLRVLDMCLEDRGYHVLDPTDIMIMDLLGYVSNEDTYDVVEGYNDQWVNDYVSVVGLDEKEEKSQVAIMTMKEMLRRISQPTVYITFKEKGETVAVGYGVIERNELGVFNIVVKEDFRGTGYGDRVMNAILTQGMRLGATESYLQVICANQVAVNLYKKMGYKKLYTYWYRRKEASI